MKDRRVNSRRLSSLRTLSIILLVAAIVFIAGFVQHSTNKKSRPTLTTSVVEAVIPERNDKVLQQSTVGIDLAVGWEARMTLNGIPIPEDEVVKTPQLGKFIFEPGPGKIVESLQSNQNCALVTYWHISEGPESAQSVSWCFTVL